MIAYLCICACFYQELGLGLAWLGLFGFQAVASCACVMLKNRNRTELWHVGMEGAVGALTRNELNDGVLWLGAQRNLTHWLRSSDVSVLGLGLKET